MKKVSAKMFFTVIWRGLCQTIVCIIGLFDYKRNNKFARCIWGLFTTSISVIIGLLAIIGVYSIGEEVYEWYGRQHFRCDDPYCNENTFIGRDIYFHNHDNGNGYIYNIRTGEKYLKHVAWIARPIAKDSLICFSDGKKRGYFSKNTCQVVIEPKYDHAWIFSDGLACVDEGGHIKFIDATGKVVIDKNMAYIPDMDGYVFHGGYCVVYTDDRERCGLMDMTGRIVLPLEFNDIIPIKDLKIWQLKKDLEYGVLDKDLKPIIPLMECNSMYISEGTINVTMPDHSIRNYDMHGTLINDFYITSVRMLEYEKDEIVYRRNTVKEDEEFDVEEFEEFYHPKATASLRAYVAGDGYEGLMTADGHRVTMPLYWEIEALDHDLYLCSSKNEDKVILDSKGEIVKQ